MKKGFFGMLSARGLAYSILQNVCFPMVLKEQYSMPNEAQMSSWVPHGVPFGSCQQQEWSINGRFVHAMHYVRCNRSKKAGCPRSLQNTRFSVSLPTNEVPSLPSFWAVQQFVRSARSQDV